ERCWWSMTSRTDALWRPTRQKEREISSTRPAIASNGPGPDCSSRKAPRGQSRPRTALIATSGSPAVKGLPDSWLLVLSCECSDELLGVLDVVQGELAGLNQVRHHRLGSTAEQGQQVVDQAALRRITGDHRLENVRIADPFGSPQCL